MKTILIVDDEFGFGETLAFLVRHAGYAVDKAWNGRMALEKIGERAPDLVLSDVMMPIMDGRELLAALKASSQWREIPVVMMSSISCLEAAELALIAGFVSKPFEVDSLLELIERLIGPPGT